MLTYRLFGASPAHLNAAPFRECDGVVRRFLPRDGDYVSRNQSASKPMGYDTVPRRESGEKSRIPRVARHQSVLQISTHPPADIFIVEGARAFQR